VHDVLTSSQYLTTLVQVGAHAAKLDGPYIECDYENVSAGRAFTCDDMTANVYVWTEWPNEQGFILIRPQILAAMDVGSMAWLCIRGVMRSRGQYTKDDAWGLVGDIFDNYGLYEIAVLEGGIWQSNNFRGERTGMSDAQRLGGLKSLGVKAYHARTPRAKIIETAFNNLQHAADRCRGYCGRNERKDCPEDVKKQKYDVEKGHAHPSKYFLHFNEYCAHLQKVMGQLNNERNDGKILRGLAPVEKWAQDNPVFKKVPDSAKWMYRSTFNLVQVTRNGVKINIGSGKHLISYTYHSIDLEQYRGRRVCVYWNDYNPDTDAVVYSIQNGKPHEFLCVAKRLQPIPRFDATDEQMAENTHRTKMVHQMAVTQSKSLAIGLQRRERTIEVGTAATSIGSQIAAARAETENRDAVKQQTRRAVNAALPKITADDRAAALAAVNGIETPAPEIPSDEIQDLLTDEKMPALSTDENPF